MSQWGRVSASDEMKNGARGMEGAHGWSSVRLRSGEWLCLIVGLEGQSPGRWRRGRVVLDGAGIATGRTWDEI